MIPLGPVFTKYDTRWNSSPQFFNLFFRPDKGINVCFLKNLTGSRNAASPLPVLTNRVLLFLN
jgi:hypothetical protein